MTALAPILDTGPNSILILRRSRDESPEALGAYIHCLRDQIPESVKVFVMHDDVEVFCLPEDVLERAGWVRKTWTPDEQAVLEECRRGGVSPIVP